GNALTPGAVLGSFAATLSPLPPPDTTPPAAALSAPDVTDSSQPDAYSFTVTYTDPGTVSAASAGPNNVVVSGPGGFVALPQLLAATPSAGGTVLTVAYFFTPPGGSWDAADNGTYTVSVGNSPVADAANNPIPPGSVLGGFTASLSPPVVPPV